MTGRQRSKETPTMTRHTSPAGPPEPSRRAAARTARGFTIVELMVAVGILVLLVSLLVPVVGKARTSARQAACANNLRQIGQSLTAWRTRNDPQPLIPVRWRTELS